MLDGTGAQLLVVLACTYVSTGDPGDRSEPAPWLAAAGHASRFGIPVIWCNQAHGFALPSFGLGGEAAGIDSPEQRLKELAKGGTVQGGHSRVLAPDGRDIGAASTTHRTSHHLPPPRNSLPLRTAHFPTSHLPTSFALFSQGPTLKPVRERTLALSHRVPIGTAVAPFGAGEPLVLAVLGNTLSHQLAWTATGLLNSCAPCNPCWRPVRSVDPRKT